MKLKILLLLSLLSFEGFSAPLKPDFLNDLTRHLRAVYPETVRGLENLTKVDSQSAHCPLFSSTLVAGTLGDLTQALNPDSEENIPFIEYLLSVTKNYIKQVEEAYHDDCETDETYSSVTSSIHKEIKELEELRENKAAFRNSENIFKVYGLLSQVLHLANDLSLKKHGEANRTDLKDNLERILTSASGHTFPYTKDSNAWKTNGKTLFYDMLSHSYSERENSGNSQDQFLYSRRGGKILKEIIGLTCPTIYCPGALKLGLTTLVLSALQENPVTLVALPVGEKGFTFAHNISMCPLDFAAHDCGHAAVTRIHLRGVYEWAEKQANQLIRGKSHEDYRDAYFIASKIASYRYNKLKKDLLHVLFTLGNNISDKKDKENKSIYNNFLVSVFTALHEIPFNMDSVLSETNSIKRLEKFFSHLLVSESLGIQEDLIRVDPVTGQSSLPFLQEEEDYNLKTNAPLRDAITSMLEQLAKENPSQEDPSPIDWDESSILKTPFSIELDLSYRNGEKKRHSIALSKSSLGTATEFNNLLKLVGKNQEEPRFEEEDDTAVKINKVDNFLKSTLLALSKQAKESTTLMHEVLEHLEPKKEFFSEKEQAAINSLVDADFTQEEAEATILKKRSKQGGGGSNKALLLEDKEVSFLLKALTKNPRIGHEQSASFLHRIIEALETSD